MPDLANAILIGVSTSLAGSFIYGFLTTGKPVANTARGIIFGFFIGALVFSSYFYRPDKPEPQPPPLPRKPVKPVAVIPRHDIGVVVYNEQLRRDNHIEQKIVDLLRQKYPARRISLVSCRHVDTPLKRIAHQGDASAAADKKLAGCSKTIIVGKADHNDHPSQLFKRSYDTDLSLTLTAIDPQSGNIIDTRHSTSFGNGGDYRISRQDAINKISAPHSLPKL
ncbi:MAG: hypothetical protein OEZ39_02440 [Gammaproteobacteria bacterium]|nr:hypothetical protein [Gammaproteobacteria bacterium]MDH5650713.1 hypothetical protein [Gammaproteobacteria bacterium]